MPVTVADGDRPTAQTFAREASTRIVRNGALVGATQLQVGDRVGVLVRAPREATLAQVAATPAIGVAPPRTLAIRRRGGSLQVVRSAA